MKYFYAALLLGMTIASTGCGSIRNGGGADTQVPAETVQESRLDFVRLSICSGRQYADDEFLQAAKEHFSGLGYRVVESLDCPGYNASSRAIRAWALRNEVDMLVLMDVRSEQADKIGNFYSYEARGRGKVVQITDSELITITSARVRGQRELTQSAAERSAVSKCGHELAENLSGEILGKTGTGILLRRFEVDRVLDYASANLIRARLVQNPNVRWVSLVKWDNQTERAVYLVRIDPKYLEELVGYIESIRIGWRRLRVTRLDKSGPETTR